MCKMKFTYNMEELNGMERKNERKIERGKERKKFKEFVHNLMSIDKIQYYLMRKSINEFSFTWNKYISNYTMQHALSYQKQAK